MAIVFEANYSKKLGLPDYSSHQYSITIRTELADINQAAQRWQNFAANRPVTKQVMEQLGSRLDMRH